MEQYIYPPSVENITDAVVAAGGLLVGVAENKPEIEGLLVYPNPINTTGFLAFHTQSDAVFSYKIVDLTGKELYRSSALQLYKGEQKIKLAVENLNNGIYFVELIVDEKIPETIRFVVAK